MQGGSLGGVGVEFVVAPSRSDLADADAAALAVILLDGEARRQADHESADAAGPALLVPGVGGKPVPLRQVLHAGGLSMVGVLSALILADALDGSAFAVLGPDIQKTMHMSDLVLGLVGSVGGLVVVFAAIPLGLLGDRTRRTALVGLCSIVWAAFAFLTGLAQTVWQLVLVRIGAGLGKANDGPVHQALIADAYPVEGRNRIFAIHRGAQPLGMLIGPALAGGIAAIAAGAAGWRWAFMVLAVPGAVLGLIAFGLREPRRGHQEMVSVLGEELGTTAVDHSISFNAGFARLKKIRTSTCCCAPWVCWAWPSSLHPSTPTWCCRITSTSAQGPAA